MNCKICNGQTYIIFDEQFQMDYHRCLTCDFIYEDPKHHMGHDEEKMEYDTHNNSIEDQGYVNMFNKFINAFTPFVNGKDLLEFGSGPEPVFSELMRRLDYNVTSFDPFYLPDESYLDKTYDVITSTEVFEHFVEPMKEMDKLVALLRPEGLLAIMTQFPKDDDHFKDWWYRRDKTHISFYTVKTFEYIAKTYNLQVVYHNDKDYMILKHTKSTD